jgi:methylated-DNA-protein-cysteine methyltransferase-like protein
MFASCGRQKRIGLDLPDMKKPTEFSLKVIEVIRRIPRGKVASYQQVAGLAGRIHASRAVVWILSSMSKKHKLPWHRVISKRGKVAFKPESQNFKMQTLLLKREGVKVDPKNGAVDMSRFQYKKMPRPRRKKNQPYMFS